MFVQLGLKLNSDMSMRIYSEASIAKNPLLAACGSLVCYSALLSIVVLKRQLLSIDNVELKTMAIAIAANVQGFLLC